MKSRNIEKQVSREILADGCLLCSEVTPLHCHRRLVAEYLQERWGDVESFISPEFGISSSSL
jgi:uncharacterized protein (DUF488 family)